MPPTAPKRSRAKPLSPDERRAAIIAATEPLVRTYGVNVTTAQIAKAAGVAEGTLFRVFPDKDSLLRETVAAALDPSEWIDQIQHIDPTAPLDDRVRAAVMILHDRMTGVIELATLIGPRFIHDADAHPHENTFHWAFSHLEAIFESDRETLTLDPVSAAQMLEMLTFSNAHPRLNRGSPMPPETVALLVLDGVRRHE